ncbi:hypothetical protein PNO24_00420 [Gemella haemolysans]|jgi:hypothetical protein|uniref:hypothetical protein n=1 Tax=Gemella haemolysans TaxID=1379 RepID=UPI00205158E8|nr:hypothetical protein [Gemella haemolysans]MDB6212390.1 hypothetical protein [Gemella haemolysans]DAW54663.1 MAG TPA: Protein of unknown function (DUF1043) [Caudoviricetes sp.]
MLKEPESILLIFIGILIGLIISMIVNPKLEKENKELKMEKIKLEQKLLKLYDEQAERTKKIAEMNEIGG